jgi:prolyl-tRNA synthetase
MAHGDERGVRLPPRVAPVQAVVVAVGDDQDTLDCARALERELGAAAVRVALDDECHRGYGRRVVDWELKGVPIRIAVGPREVREGQLTLERRDGEAAERISIGGAGARVPDLLEDIQTAMRERSQAFREQATTPATTIPEALAGAQRGVARVPWDTVGASGERALQSVGVTIRCLQRADGSLPDGPEEPDLVAFAAHAY